MSACICPDNWCPVRGISRVAGECKRDDTRPPVSTLTDSQAIDVANQMIRDAEVHLPGWWPEVSNRLSDIAAKLHAGECKRGDR
jgi:hypothetical protein